MQTRRENRSVAPRWRASDRGLWALEQKKKSSNEGGRGWEWKMREETESEGRPFRSGPGNWPILVAWTRYGESSEASSHARVAIEFLYLSSEKRTAKDKKERRRECRNGSQVSAVRKMPRYRGPSSA